MDIMKLILGVVILYGLHLVGLFPYFGVAYTALLHFTQFDDKIRNAEGYSETWATNPATWKISDFIPENFSNTNATKDELFMDYLIYDNMKDDKEIETQFIEKFGSLKKKTTENFENESNTMITPLRLASIGLIIIIYMIMIKMKGSISEEY